MNKVKEIIDCYFNIICTILMIFLVSGIIYLSYNKFSKKQSSDNNTLNEQVSKEDISYESKKIKVDIKGQVKKSGVYEIDSDSTVYELIKLAGGLTKNGTTENINLSKKLEDQMVIRIFSKKELRKKDNVEVSECVCSDVNIEKCIDSPVIKQEGNNINVNSVENSDENNKLISINTASKEELMTLSSIGEAKAKAIISYRETNGLFKSIEDIKNVSGIGDALYEKIKDSITI